MLWEIDIVPRGRDAERARVAEENELLTHTSTGAGLVAASSRGYLLEGELTREQAELLLNALLVDSLGETGRLGSINEHAESDRLATVLLKPGVMDPVALSVVDAARDLGLSLESVRSFRRYRGAIKSPETRNLLF